MNVAKYIAAGVLTIFFIGYMVHSALHLNAESTYYKAKALTACYESPALHQVIDNERYIADWCLNYVGIEWETQLYK